MNVMRTETIHLLFLTCYPDHSTEAGYHDLKGWICCNRCLEPYTSRSPPVGRIAYYVTAWLSLADIASKPFQAFLLLGLHANRLTLVHYSYILDSNSGSSARDVAKKLKTLHGIKILPAVS